MRRIQRSDSVDGKENQQPLQKILPREGNRPRSSSMPSQRRDVVGQKSAYGMQPISRLNIDTSRNYRSHDRSALPPNPSSLNGFVAYNKGLPLFSPIKTTFGCTLPSPSSSSPVYHSAGPMSTPNPLILPPNPQNGPPFLPTSSGVPFSASKSPSLMTQ